MKPLDSFVSASTSAWQFSHHGSAARALIVPGHAARARVSPAVGSDQCVPRALLVMMRLRSVVVGRAGRAADWNLARRTLVRTC